MNITPISCRACNSKNQTNYQNTPNFKATIVSKVGRNISNAKMDKHCQWLRKLIIANLPVSNPKEYCITYDGDKLLAPIDTSLFEQAKDFVKTIKRHLKDHGIRFDEIEINLDPRNVDDILETFPF